MGVSPKIGRLTIYGGELTGVVGTGRSDSQEGRSGSARL